MSMFSAARKGALKRFTCAGEKTSLAMTGTFEVDPRVMVTTLPLGETELCLVRLVNDSRYPWLVLVPRRPGIVELFDLSSDERHALVDLASDIAAGMAAAFDAEKVNIGSLGNRVRQFHLHIVVRRSTDAAWPDAVWNDTPAVPYDQIEADAVLVRLRACLPGS